MYAKFVIQNQHFSVSVIHVIMNINPLFFSENNYNICMQYGGTL